MHTDNRTKPIILKAVISRVFACGLLLALVTVWNVDIGLDRPDNMYEVSDVVEGSQDVQKDNLQEAGKVYRDPATGNLYFIEE